MGVGGRCDLKEAAIAAAVEFDSGRSESLLANLPCAIFCRFESVCRMLIAGSCNGMFSFLRDLLDAIERCECLMTVARWMRSALIG